jgi:poly-gamma-glutamate synthesis protein (capsule biosynthesis protein)
MTLSAIFTLKTHDVFIFMKRRVMQLSIILSVAILFTLLPNQTAESSLQVQPPPVTHELTLIFAGDIMQHMPQVDAAWNPETGVYNYDSCFLFIKPWLSGADLAIANFETTLAGKPYSGYPAFSSPDEIVNGMLNAGIDITGTANNHCCDRGRIGIERTIGILDSLGMSHMGTYTSEESYRKTTPLIINKSGFRIAFLNYTYGLNGNPVPENNVVSLIEKDRILHDLTAARDSLVDKIIVFIHWGDEYEREPNAFQNEIADFLFGNGADIVVGSHPHVIQPMEWHKADSISKERLVVWSLGNFVSNQRKRYTDGGATFKVTLQKEAGKTSIKDAGYLLTWVYNPIRNGMKYYYILPVQSFENDSSFMDAESYAAMKLFAADSRDLLKGNSGIPEIRY